MCNDLKCFEKFLADNILHTQTVKLQKLTKGGSSLNFRAKTEEGVYVIKLLLKTALKKIQHISELLQELQHVPGFYTARQIFPNNRDYFEYDGYIGIVQTYINGRKIKSFELLPDFLAKVYKNYQLMQNVSFKNESIILPFRSGKELFEDNKKQIAKLRLTCHNFLQLKFLNIVEKYNEEIFYNCIEPNKPQTIIHGDFSLNNILLDDKQNVAFLDFEFLRYGYASEDFMMLVLSALLQHSVFFIQQQQLELLIKHLKLQNGFSKEEVLYGIHKYFQFLIHRRLHNSKIFKSVRKNWLFVLYLKKYHLVLKTVDEVYQTSLSYHLAECI